MNIFEIKNELLNIFQEIEDNDGELTPELEAAFSSADANLKDKIEGFTAYIKHLDADANLIDAEVARLRKLKESKTKTKDRLSKILIEIVKDFGEEQKNGVKYYDYGTGKVSLRKSTSVEVYDELPKAIVKTAISHLQWLQDIRQIDTVDALDENSIIEGIKIGEQDEEGNCITPGMDIVPQELTAVDAKITFNVPVVDLINGKAFNAMKGILKYTDCYKAEAAVNKTSIKDKLLENGSYLPNLAKLNNNLSLVIK